MVFEHLAFMEFRKDPIFCFTNTTIEHKILLNECTYETMEMVCIWDLH